MIRCVIKLKRIDNFFNINSLKGRLHFWFLSFLALVVLASAIPFVFLEIHHQREEAKENFDKMMDVQQLVAETWLKNRKAYITSLSQSIELQSSNENKNELLKTFARNDNEFLGIGFVNRDGVTEIYTSGYTGIDVSDRDYYQEAKKGKVFVTDVIIGKVSKKPLIVVSAPVYDREHQFRGLVFGTIELSTISKVMQQFQDNDRETYLVDGTGMIITKTRQGKVGELLKTSIIENAVNGSGNHSYYASSSGEMVLGSYRWVHNKKWLIIGEIKQSTIHKPVYESLLIFFGIILLIVIFGSVLLIKISKQVGEPIQKVLESTTKFAEGNWGYRIDPSSYKDEVEELQELSGNFNQMADMIESYIYSVAKSEEQFRTIMQYSSDMITIHDTSGKYLYVSPAGKEILEYEDEEILGHDSYIFIHPEDREQIVKGHEELLRTGYVVTTYRIRKKNNEYIWFESSVKYMKEQNEDDSRLFTVSRNITERKMVEQQLQEANKLLKELSTKDGLTGIWNRRSFDETLDKEWKRAERNNHPLSLIMLDIDFFKAYNDTYGHQGGDDCLREVANAIKNSIEHESDMAFRYGGEEFGIILPETDVIGAKTVAEKVRSTIENLKISHVGSKIQDFVTISLGTATIIPTKYKNADSLVESADKALYQAKQEGRNCVRSYQKD